MVQRILCILVFVFGAAHLQNVKGGNGQCRLEPHPSVEYQCLAPEEQAGRSRECGALEPEGTVVKPLCRSPNYYAPEPLPLMRCSAGAWDSIARCTPECGRVTPVGASLVVGGRAARRGELPWHAGIYSTTTQPYLQVCGGSLISTDVVLSAAHCFWTDLEKQLPASRFAVAVGKLYRPWNDAKDKSQKSTVRKIRIPERFQGTSANFQDDIAVVVVAEPFQLQVHVRPACLSFDALLERQQLVAGNKGKVAGWGLRAEDGRPSPTLLVVELPYVEVGVCIRDSPLDYQEFITSDKICAGTLQPGTALCRGDSGGGLAFLSRGAGGVGGVGDAGDGKARFFLRGLVSTAPASNHACNTRVYTGFTAVSKHERFVKEYWTETGEFRCSDGGYILASRHCDGIADCADASDETARSCAYSPCSRHLFRCKYGACIDRSALCDQVRDCVDGSDEVDCVCRTARDAPPVPGYEFDARTGLCYKFFGRDLNWGRARDACALDGALLAVPSPPSRLAVLKELFKAHPPFSLPGVTYRNYLAVGAFREGDVWKTLEGAEVPASAWYPGWPRYDENDTTVVFMERDGHLENYRDDASSIRAPYYCQLQPAGP